MPTFLYVLEVQTSSLRSEVLINNVPVFTDEGDESKISQTKINHWIIDGTNKIEVRLGLPMKRTTGTRAFIVKLIWGEHGRDPGESGVIVSYEWSVAQQSLKEALIPVFTKEFQPRKSFGRWDWQDSAINQPTPPDREQIIRIIRRVHRSLATKDSGSLNDLLSTYTAEMARSLGMSKAELEEDQKEFFQTLFSTPEWRMEPLNENMIKLEVVANGRLVQARSAGDKPLLVGRGIDRTYANDFTFGKVKGEWRILPEST